MISESRPPPRTSSLERSAATSAGQRFKSFRAHHRAQQMTPADDPHWGLVATSLVSVSDDERDGPVEDLATAPRGDASPPIELRSVRVHARSALRRHRDTFAALDIAASEGPASLGAVDATLRAQGETTQGVLALYLAASAAARYRRKYDDPGPLDGHALDDLLRELRALRHTIMQWETDREPETFMSMDSTEIVALEPHGPTGRDVVARLTWAAFERAASRLDAWATEKLGDS